MNFWKNDKRGSSAELLKFLSTNPLVAQVGEIDQIFVSRSKRGVFRGFHYQIDTPQTKYIFVLEGVIDDYLLDLAYVQSPTNTLKDYLCHFRLSEHSNANFLEVPPNSAHGYYVHSESALLLYLICGPYDQERQRVYRINEDHALRQSIEKYSEIKIQNAIMSSRDG